MFLSGEIMSKSEQEVNGSCEAGSGTRSSAKTTMGNSQVACAGSQPGSRDQVLEYLDNSKAEFSERWSKKPEQQGQLSDYELKRTLGTGSFGRVILAKRSTADEYFAIKILNKSRIVKLKQVEHALMEKRILASINFPFIVDLVDYFKDNSNLYMVMEVVNGGEMFTYIRKMQRLKESDAKFFAAQVVMAFQYLHHLDIIYRDLKPENILIDHTGKIWMHFSKLCRFFF